MSESIKADVVVIGAGPAGSAAAILCAQSGLNAIIVERERFPRDHAGETVHPGIEPLLNRLGVLGKVLAAGFPRHNGIWVQWDSERQFTSFGGGDGTDPWKGFQVWRADFDAILLDQCRQLGVKILQPCQVLKPILNPNRDGVEGVSTSRGSIHSPYVIDASGSQHWLAKQLKINIKKYSPLLLASYGYAEGKHPSYENAPSITADSEGWTWIAKVRPLLYHWTRLYFSAECFDKEFIPRALSGMRKKGLTHSADVTWRIVSTPAGRGYFMVGDAASVLDPSYSHGILKAIMSGMMASHLIKKTNSNKELRDIAIMEYHKWVTSWFTHDSNKLKEFYLKLADPPAWMVRDKEDNLKV